MNVKVFQWFFFFVFVFFWPLANHQYCPNQNFRQICLQIRSLVQQRGEQDRRLLALEDDLKKSEAKLLAAVREKTGLSASVITLARQRAELKKVNEFLKNKVRFLPRHL